MPIIAGRYADHFLGTYKRIPELGQRPLSGHSAPAAPCNAIGRRADPEAIKAVGLHWATEQARDLLTIRHRRAAASTIPSIILRPRAIFISRWKRWAIWRRVP